MRQHIRLLERRKLIWDALPSTSTHLLSMIALSREACVSLGRGKYLDPLIPEAFGSTLVRETEYTKPTITHPKKKGVRAPRHRLLQLLSIQYRFAGDETNIFLSICRISAGPCHLPHERFASFPSFMVKSHAFVLVIYSLSLPTINRCSLCVPSINAPIASMPVSPRTCRRAGVEEVHARGGRGGGPFDKQFRQQKWQQ